MLSGAEVFMSLQGTACLTAYANGSELVLKHWLWMTLRNKSHNFGAILPSFVDS